MIDRKSQDIPMPIIKAASALIERYGHNIRYIGRYQRKDVYVFAFPEDLEVGFPFIYIYEDCTEKAIEITGPDALDIIAKTSHDE